MTQPKPTTQNGKIRLSIVGFVELSGTNSLIARVPGATYLLSSDAWGGLMTRGLAWGTEISRIMIEDEVGANSVRWIVNKSAIIIEDLITENRFCIRFDDLMAISGRQQLPIYGRDNPAWKYRSPIIAEMEKALPVVA